MEQQQQLQGPHWSWVNLLDLSRNLTKPYVDAQQERERIKLGKIQAGTQGLSAIVLASVLNKWQQRALQAEDISKSGPDFIGMRSVLNNLLDTVSKLNIEEFANERNVDMSSEESLVKYQVLREGVVFASPYVDGNSVITPLETIDGNYIGNIRATKTDVGIHLDTSWVDSELGKRFMNEYTIGGLPTPELLKYYQSSTKDISNMFERSASNQASMTRQTISTTLSNTSDEVNKEFESARAYFEKLVNGK